MFTLVKDGEVRDPSYISNRYRYARYVGLADSILDFDERFHTAMRDASNEIADNLADDGGMFGFDMCLSIVRYVEEYGSDAIFEIHCNEKALCDEYRNLPWDARRSRYNMLTFRDGAFVRLDDCFVCSLFIERAVHDAIMRHNDDETAWRKAEAAVKELKGYLDGILEDYECVASEMADIFKITAKSFA